MDHLSVQQHKEALDDEIYRAIVQFESEAHFSILEIKVNRLNVGEKTICTSVSTEVKK